MNVEFYKSLIPYCEKFGIKVACENMWQWNNGNKAPSDSTCSRAWEFNKYLDAIDSEWIVGCLDVGHAFLVNEDIPAFIRGAAPRLKALHVHDTDYRSDKHTAPFMEKIDFEAFSDCSKLEKIQLPNTLKTIEAKAFNECIALSECENINRVKEILAFEATKLAHGEKCQRHAKKAFFHFCKL